MASVPVILTKGNMAFVYLFVTLKVGVASVLVSLGEVGVASVPVGLFKGGVSFVLASPSEGVASVPS